MVPDRKLRHVLLDCDRPLKNYGNHHADGLLGDILTSESGQPRDILLCMKCGPIPELTKQRVMFIYFVFSGQARSVVYFRYQQNAITCSAMCRRFFSMNSMKTCSGLGICRRLG